MRLTVERPPLGVGRLGQGRIGGVVARDVIRASDLFRARGKLRIEWDALEAQLGAPRQRLASGSRSRGTPDERGQQLEPEQLGVLGTKTTSRGGRYLFTGVLAGTYIVNVVDTTVPYGFALTTGNDPMAITLAGGQCNLTADFGCRNPCIPADCNDGNPCTTDV